MKHAFSGGQVTKKDQEKFGANVDIDVAYQYLTFFYDNEAHLEEIREVFYIFKLNQTHIHTAQTNTNTNTNKYRNIQKEK